MSIRLARVQWRCRGSYLPTLASTLSKNMRAKDSNGAWRTTLEICTNRCSYWKRVSVPCDIPDRSDGHRRRVPGQSVHLTIAQCLVNAFQKPIGVGQVAFFLRPANRNPLLEHLGDRTHMCSFDRP